MADVSDAGPAKRPRSASPNHAATPFPEKGEDTTEFLPDRGLLLRHGTSLSLMALVADWLNATSEEFEQVPGRSLCGLGEVGIVRAGPLAVLCRPH